MKLSAWLVAAVTGSLVAACAEPAGPERVTVLGEIAGYHRDDPRITVAATGRRVEVSVTTYGDGCYAKADTRVTVSGLIADVEPHDFALRGDVACPSVLLSFTHAVAIDFATGGTARIRVRGIDASTRSAANPAGDTLVVERTIELP